MCKPIKQPLGVLSSSRQILPSDAAWACEAQDRINRLVSDLADPRSSVCIPYRFTTGQAD